MAVLTQYRHLFTVRIVHEYYLPRETILYESISEEVRDRIFHQQLRDYDISADLEIVPTEDCTSLLKNYKLIFKRNNFGFFLGCKTETQDTDHYKPFISFDEPLCLRFAVYLRNNKLLNFTNLRREKDKNRKDNFLYYFSNRSNNLASPDTLYLSKPISDFDDTKDYEAGEIYLDNTVPANPEMYEAIMDNGPDVIDSSNWIQIFSGRDPLPRFVTNNDRIVLRPKIFSYDVSRASLEKLSIIIKDYDGNQVGKRPYETPKPGEPLTHCELDLSDFPPAFYSIEVWDDDDNPVDDSELSLYLDNTLHSKKPFALIECFHFPDGSLADYKLLDESNDNRLLSPEYVIHWKNRSTFWRYYYSNPPEFTETPELAIYKSSGVEISNILVTKNPLGLTQFNRRFSAEINDKDTFLPNADIASIFPEQDRIYSEINMGGGLGPPPVIQNI